MIRNRDVRDWRRDGVDTLVEYTGHTIPFCVTSTYPVPLLRQQPSLPRRCFQVSRTRSVDGKTDERDQVLLVWTAYYRSCREGIPI